MEHGGNLGPILGLVLVYIISYIIYTIYRYIDIIILVLFACKFFIAQSPLTKAHQSMKEVNEEDMNTTMKENTKIVW